MDSYYYTMDGACKTGKIVGPPQAARVQRGAPLLYCAPACGGKVVAQPPKGGGPIGPAGCVEGLCSLTLKGKVAAPPQFLAPFLGKGVAP